MRVVLMRAAVCTSVWLSLAGCAGPGPHMFPLAPQSTRALPDGSLDRIYDTDGDGRPDYCEHLNPGGVLSHIRYGMKADDQWDEDIDLAAIDHAQRRQIIFLLDSVPYQVAKDLWDHGRLRFCHEPKRSISPFPVMTDLSFAEFFGVSPCTGVEASFYDGHKLQGGYTNYIMQAEAPWYDRVDYHMINIAHSVAYLYPEPWTDHEFREIQKTFLERPGHLIVGYSVGTSALGAMDGRSGHQFGLIHVDRLCQWLIHETRGRIQITLMSDHGHNLMHSERVPLPEMLKYFGYNISKKLEKPEDIVVPQFGVVTYASIHTTTPETVARDVAGMTGIEQTAYRDDQDRVIVMSADGRAVISQRDNRFSYQATHGDPLKLLPILDGLRREGKADADGFIEDRLLLEATKMAPYPDAVHRLWRAFHGLIQHTPDVMVAVKDGWHSGSKFMTKAVYLRAAHGNLGQLSSYGFVATSAGDLPPVTRMQDLREELVRLGVDIPPPPATSEAPQPDAPPAS